MVNATGATDAIVTGSRPLTSYVTLSSPSPNSAADAIPTAVPTTVISGPPHQIALRRSQRHPHTELVRAPVDRVGDRAVDPDCGQAPAQLPRTNRSGFSANRSHMKK